VSDGRPATPPISVVIPTRNRADRIARTVAPLLAEPQTHELIVVVDGSTDDTLAVLERIARDDPRLRPLATEGRGAMAARHTGLVSASGEVVLLVDDDVIAAPGLVAGHARAHAGQERLVVTGYMPVAARRRRPGDFPRTLYAREYERTVEAWERDPGAILPSLWAGNLSIRRKDYLAVADDVPQVVHGYHEDMEFGLLCLEAGLTGRFDRSLRATHEYERDVAGFLRDARSSGTNLPIVHGRHHSVVGALTPDFHVRGVPAPLRPVVAAGAGFMPVRTLTRAGVTTAGALRLFTFERRLAGLLWRMEQGRAAHERSRT
jgi:glycosyltransferase involved in cell wall biosynthesis